MDQRGNRITDDHFLLFFNGGGPIEVTIPPEEYAAAWDVVIDTGALAGEPRAWRPGEKLPMEQHSVVVLREHGEPEAEPDHSVAASVAAQSESGTNGNGG